MRLSHAWMLGGIYMCSELVLVLTRKAVSGDRSPDRSSLRLLWLAIFAGVAGGIIAAKIFLFAALPSSGLVYAGIVVFAIGIALRWYAIIRLGRFFTVDVSIATDHKVIDTGPYRFVRHPSYSGALLAFFGFGLCLQNWVSVLVVMAPITAAFLWRVHVEERALSDALGEDYRRYATCTKRLIPFVY
jgi:protein-S-isoprenylcysteine O-methyltransferase